MTVTDRLLDYVKFDTQSDELTNMTPSTPGQMIFARHLRDILTQMGLSEITLDENGYLMATLEANNGDATTPTVGFIAHLDTSPDMSGRHVNPRIVKNYDGNDITLNSDEGIVLSPTEFPELMNYVGQDLIVTDGTTLLGADDKAGIAEIVTAVAYLQAHPEIKHGKIRIGFTPDEEVGRGVDFFDVKAFGADFAYTVDGGMEGELEYENFNAAAVTLTVEGVNIHPGSAKNKMKNAILLANQFISMLPAAETPSHTEGYEGFYHVTDLAGNESQVVLHAIIRDHDLEKFNARKDFVERLVDYLNARWGQGTFRLEMKDSYYNMKEKIEPCMYLIDIAKEAMTACGIEPEVVPIRGGTDGARLSYMGLPCPNLCTGGYNYHGKYEFIPVDSLHKTAEILVKIASLFS